MKITRLLSISILLSVFFSCSHGFLKDPRLYNPKRTTVQTVAPEPELQLTGGVDPFDKIGEWYNNPDSNGDATNPEEGFAAKEFNQIQITGWFSDKNVPTYTMTKGDVWKEGDASKREYVHSNAPSTEGQGWSITGVTYYQYRGINPNYEATGNYNVSLQTTKEGNHKLNRFYFYRFTGKGGGVQWLDNYLIAVDTYSKLIFAFSEPVEFSSMGAPTKWDPTDNEAFYGTTYQFYMYDPVGYVLKKDDGSYEIQLYQWFQDSLAAGNYKANINTAYTKIAEKRGKNDDGEDGAGKSPFNSHDVNFFEENMKLLHGKVFQRREKTSDGLDGLILYHYTVSEDGKTITRTAESYDPLRSLAEELKTVTYEVSVDTTSKEMSATKGQIIKDGTVGSITIENQSHKIELSYGNTIEVAQTQTIYTDPGPAFQLRVGGMEKGRTYKNDKYKYIFSKDGLSVGYYKNNQFVSTWTLNGGEGNNTESTYRDNNWTVFDYWGMRLSSNDTVLEVTTGQGSTIYETLHMRAWGDPLYLEREQGDTFDKTIAGLSFDVRRQEEDRRWDRYLWTWSFSADGKKATLWRTPWNGSREFVIHEVDISSMNAKNGTGGGYTFSLNDKLNELTVSGGDANGNGKFTFGYSDPGPHFLWRVAGTTFVGDGGKTVYTFSEDGTRLTWKYYATALSWSQTVEEFDYEVNPDNIQTAVYGGYRIGFAYNDNDRTIAYYQTPELEVYTWRATRQ